MSSTVALGQACPSSDPDTDYNCPAGPVYAVPSFGNVPWLNPEYFQTIQTGDVDGDGVDDLIARDAKGLHLYMYDASLGTWKPVLTTQGGDELVLEDFSDTQGWGTHVSYYGSIKLARLNIAGDFGFARQLVARSAHGLAVYEFVRTDDKLGFPTGSWKQLSKNGPFADKDGWGGDAAYGLNLSYGSLDGYTPVVVGWGKAGLETWIRVSSGWQLLDTSPGFGDAAQHPIAANTMRLVNIDGRPADSLVLIGDQGLVAYQLRDFNLPGSGGWELKISQPAGIFTSDGGCDPISCTFTLRTAKLDGVVNRVIMARRSGCNKRAGGMMGVTLDPGNTQWRVVFAVGPFNDCGSNGFKYLQSYWSIMAADIDGDGSDELIGRGANGVLAYRWSHSTGRWSPMVTNTPVLSNPLWSNDPAYWMSLRTARIDGRKHALLARGSAGMRTWLYDGTSFARPKPYGGFPTLDPASYQAINTLLNLPNGVRLSYTDGTTAATMNNYITTLASKCQNASSGNPPQFQTCEPPIPGTKNPEFTATVNQLLLELTFAIAANGYFDQLGDMQSKQFLSEALEFPSIEDNLQLAQAKHQPSVMPYLNLFASIARFVASLIGPEATIVVNGMSVAVSTAGLFESSDTSTKHAQEYADIQGTIASLQQQAQNNTLASKSYVAGDYALLSSVGRLRASQVWRMDEGAYLSASRYAFTQWVMQQLLPSFYDTWQVYRCVGDCHPPPVGSNLYNGSYTTDPDGFGIDFIATLQKPGQELPCIGAFGSYHCFFNEMGMPKGLQNLVFGQLTPECRKGWVYPSPNNPAGCSLQAGPSIFFNEGGWNFTRHVCDAILNGPRDLC